MFRFVEMRVSGRGLEIGRGEIFAFASMARKTLQGKEAGICQNQSQFCVGS